MSMQNSLTQRRTSGRGRRERALTRLTNAIEATFDEVVNAQVDAATPGTWESATIFVQIESGSTTYYPDAIHQRTGYEISANLRSIAPRLYNFLRGDECIASMQVLDRPEALTDESQENLYNRDYYLLDVVVP